ncbi:pullulanase [Streptococcus sp. UBA4344]|uniref:pullulanase n=1 Tax=Streptococcus sp. UBA4344 TaxID=1947564 RepID=UPI00257BEE72|nr:pullulanase [Streptococcus sp. UBA4344]
MKKISRLSFPEKRECFGIRKLKVGVASVAIATALFWGAGITSVSADQVNAQLAAEEEMSDNLLSVTEQQKTSEFTEVVNQTLNTETNEPTNSVDETESQPTVAAEQEVEQDLQTSEATSKSQGNQAVNELSNSETVGPESSTSETTTETANQINLLNSPQSDSQVSNPPIAENTIRVHFQAVTDDNYAQYGLWTWGAVAEPSDGNNWPAAATPFSANQKDEFGYYIDLKQAASHGDIGYLLLKNGEKTSDSDQSIKPLSKDANEVWVTSDFTTYSYKPLADDRIIRINYKRDDGNYDGWGLWAWGDVASQFGTWPTDALDFTQEGAYGRYIDLPLSKLLDSNIGFLLVNQNDPDKSGNKTLDMAFSDREIHSQIFLHNDDATVYTNPYYVATVTGQDFSKATPGVHNVSVAASSYRPFNYNETDLIDVTVTNPENVDITRMQVDTTQIGGGIIEMSPELNRVTITATSDTQPGNYSLPVRVFDKDNGYYDTTVSVTVTKRVKQANEVDWDEQVIYFMLTDRFYNGDPSNDDPYHQDYAKAVNQAGVYKGGDFKGVTAKLDYLKQLGVTSIWVTPIVENVPQNVSTEAGKEYYAYHGYWADDFEKLNPHLGTLDDFHELIDQAAERGINIIVDVVLNHSGYGTEDKFAGMVRTPEEDKGDDIQGSQSGLPDFKTEEKAVREQLVAWQTAWLEKSTTEKGNSIYAFRVDTVKHVDDTTWQYFKNELALKDADFHLVGESWGANYKDTKGDLGTGSMDSLLDFGFKDIAKLLVNGRLKDANDELIARNDALTSAYTLAQFLGSHDEDGFLYSIGGDLNKLKLAATLLLTAKGQPVIYYGEELGQSGANNWPYYDNRYEFDWNDVTDNEVLEHYQKLLAFRRDNSELLARGSHSTVAVNDSQGWLLAKRANDSDAAYILYNLKDQSQKLHLLLTEAATVTDYYTGATYQALLGQDGQYYLDIEAPAISKGGTMLLKVSAGAITQAFIAQTEEEPIAENTLRVHFKTLPSDDLASLGLWTWEDVEHPSESWPNGALNFSNAKRDAYGYYLDVKLVNANRHKVGLLINNSKGDNVSGDKLVNLISQDMNEVWFDENYNANYYAPLEKGKIRINYYRSDGNYKNLAIWLWGSADGSITSRMGAWPDGVDFENFGKYGAYIDVPLADFNELGFLLLDESKEGDAAKIQPDNYTFKDLANQTQIFLKDEDKTIYTNPYFVSTVRLTSAQQISQTELSAIISNLADADKDNLLENLKVSDKDGNPVAITAISLDAASNKVTITGDFSAATTYTVSYAEDHYQAKRSWQYMDSQYAYDGELGARVSEEGARVDLTVWSPSADSVSLVLYDKNDQTKVLGKVAMAKGDKGDWSVTLTPSLGLGITDYRGYYYHYEITRGEDTVLALDPYAKSLAEWNSDLIGADPSYKVAKAAIVDTSAIGNQDMTYADIKGYTAREDAIIYEAHVRDFTSDTAISEELRNQFGTFAAFAEKLDYLQSLGVTHIQLLPVMSYYYVNEAINSQRLTDYASSNTNYNWGYDPQSYFALTGMYSENPSDPAKRIAEFKNLINEIHNHGMGIILDVVYNHTADLAILEDLEPNYYHFMEADGKAKTSFGGGRPGTTHYMTRRMVLDSIAYWTKEFKVDGFRFDMMGDLDAQTVQMAYDIAKALNPNVIMLGEGWITYAGDANDSRQPADQTWMAHTDSVASFSDDIRNLLKSGYPSEGLPCFITGGVKDLQELFNTIKAQPNNFTADDPGDVIQYIAAHDNLTLHDIIAKSIHKDPSVAENESEILRRQRLGNLIILTSQGTAFIHSGQEYGRTKQFRDEAYKTPVSADKVPEKSDLLTNLDGTPFDYPYFISDSYDSTDAINHFDWTKATDKTAYPEHAKTQAYTKGLIALRRSTDAFTLKTKEEVDSKVKLITVPNENGVGQEDLIIAYQTQASNGDIYAVFINADSKARDIVLSDAYKALLNAEVVADSEQAGSSAILNPKGVSFTENSVTLDPLTATILRLRKASAETERTLYDQASGVSVVLAPGEREDIKKIEVSHQETNDAKTPEILTGDDYDLFDIQPTDDEGHVLDITKTARVILPVDAGKTISEVFYLPVNGQPQSLTFQLMNRVIDGHLVTFAVFDVDHFSQYGIVYQDKIAENEVSTDSNQASQALETAQNQNKAVFDALNNLETAKVVENSTGALPETGQRNSNVLSFVGLLSLASLAVLEVKRHKKNG